MCLLAGSPVGANVTIHFCPFLTTHHSRQPIRFTKETFTSKVLENADDSKMESNIVTHQKIAIKYCDAPSSKLIKSTSAGHIEKENHYTTLLSEKQKSHGLVCLRHGGEWDWWCGGDGGDLSNGKKCILRKIDIIAKDQINVQKQHWCFNIKMKYLKTFSSWDVSKGVDHIRPPFWVLGAWSLPIRWSYF